MPFKLASSSFLAFFIEWRDSYQSASAVLCQVNYRASLLRLKSHIYIELVM